MGFPYVNYVVPCVTQDEERSHYCALFHYDLEIVFFKSSSMLISF